MKGSTCRLLAAAALAAIFLVAACGQLPRPFAPDLKAPWTGAPQLADGAGVVVQAAQCAPGPELAESVAAALRARDVPAATGGGNQASFRLVCSPGAGGGAPVLSWRLLAADGASLGVFDQDAGESRGIDALADDAAGRAIGVLGLDAGAGDETPSFVVLPVAGAPGDGPVVLSRAMAAALGRAGARVAPEPGDETLLVLGTVLVSDAAGRGQRVEVTWEVLEPDGRRLGVVRQQNTVPRGTLDGAWGAHAVAIAEYAAGGVLELLARASAP